jgi:hypothetical protein
MFYDAYKCWNEEEEDDDLEQKLLEESQPLG